MKRIELAVLIGIILLALIATCTKIAIGTLFTTGGFEFSQIQDKTTSLQLENTILKEQLLKDESFFTIASEAAALGFEFPKGNQTIVLSSPNPIAYNQ